MPDPEGRVWIVFEVSGPSYDRRASALVFDGGDVVRRVRKYPANWFDQGDDELLRLSENP